jgi:hypothetical protein
MRSKFLFTLLLTNLSLLMFAQNGSVTIHKDARLNQKIADYGLVIPPNPTPQIDGYRVQLAFEQSKEAIENAKSQFSKYYPDIDLYVIYKAPNFFLKAGDFRTFNEAEKIKSKVEADFPTSNVIREKINLPKI